MIWWVATGISAIGVALYQNYKSQRVIDSFTTEQNQAGVIINKLTSPITLSLIAVTAFYLSKR